MQSSLGVLRQFVSKLGPYLMLEALLPGGTLLALLLLLYRSRKLNTRGPALGATRATCSQPHKLVSVIACAISQAMMVARLFLPRKAQLTVVSHPRALL